MFPTAHAKFHANPMSFEGVTRNHVESRADRAMASRTRGPKTEFS